MKRLLINTPNHVLPITFQEASSTFSLGASTTVDYTFTIGTTLGANGYVTAEIAGWSDSTAPVVTAVTFDFGGSNTAMTDLSSGGAVVTPGFGGRARAYIWGAAVGAKAAGTYTIRVTFDAGAATREYNYAARSYNGVHQSASAGTAAKATGTSSTPSVDVTSASGELVIDCFVHFTNSESPTAAGQTERWDENQATDGAGSERAGQTTTTMSWSTGGSDAWAQVGVPLKPA